MKREEKKVKVFFTPEVNQKFIHSVKKAFEIISREAGLERNIAVEICDFQSYFSPREEKPIKYKTLDQLFEESLIKGSKQIDSIGFLTRIFAQLISLHQDNYLENYYLIITQKYDLTAEDCNFIIGSSIDEFGVVISLLRITGHNLPSRDIPERMTLNEFENEIVTTVILHEFGHVFGCAKEGRRYTKNILGSHDDPEYINNCVMLQGLSVPDDWIEMTKKRLKSQHAFCELCREELKEYFST